jgi:hypothetical protein
MKRLFFYLMIFSMVLAGSGCVQCVDGEGHIVSVTRSIKPFTKLELNMNAHVEVGVTSKATMQIHAQKNIAELITTKVEGDKLVIETSKCLGNYEPVLIHVFTTALEEIEVNGSGTVKSRHPVTVNKIEFEVDGSGKIFADVYANKVEAEVDGSGEVVINGTVNSQKIEIEGSGFVQTTGLKADDTAVEINGSGRAEVSSLNTLNVSIRGSGRVIYSGDPKVESKISGSGSVSRMRR